MSFLDVSNSLIEAPRIRPTQIGAAINIVEFVGSGRTSIGRIPAALCDLIRSLNAVNRFVGPASEAISKRAPAHLRPPPAQSRDAIFVRTLAHIERFIEIFRVAPRDRRKAREISSMWTIGPPWRAVRFSYKSPRRRGSTPPNCSAQVKAHSRRSAVAWLAGGRWGKSSLALGLDIAPPTKLRLA